MTDPRTLYEYLTRPNPAIELQESLAESPPYYTKSIEYPSPAIIRKWSEFNLTTVQRLFSQRLRQTLNTESDLHDFSHIHASYCKVHDEDSLEALIVKSNQSILLESLEHTSQDLLLQSVSMVRGGQAQLYHTWRDRIKANPKVRAKEKLNTKSKWYPDWAGLADVHGYNNILPGDTKLSRNWRSEDLKQFIGRKGQEALQNEPVPSLLWPVRQLLHYCIESHMRYGYIITDEELVVMRVRPTETQNPGATIEDLHGATRDNPLVEFQSIPWERSNSSKGLSVNLALYVLFILAANNGVLGWTYGSLLDEKLPIVRPQDGLCNQYPSFSTDAEYSQTRNSNVEAHSQGALANSAPGQMSTDFDGSQGRKRSRSLTRRQQDRNSSRKKPRN
ncbi:hypothetical protein F4823DRAFT_616893 [Ustulina deusta]|nr:hypothetical protein F4823DRAFT_616893 [Ustulina deusta]